MTAASAHDREELLRRAVVALRDAKGELARLQEAQSAPVAVVGMGCRFPGGVSSPESFWDLLVAGADAVSDVPKDRWEVTAHDGADPDAPGHDHGHQGGFLDDVAGFDAGLFGIPPREAVWMDPQQRLVLEVAWEALEHAGIAPDGLRGSRTGVFVGLSTTEYLHRAIRFVDPDAVDAYVATGNAPNAAAGRLSYLLGLQGPSMAVDTACSSSLVAVHLASQSLRTQECDLVLAGGVNLLLLPETFVALSRAQMLSITGRCRTFDATADGYVRGEGCGFVVLRRLADAVAGGERVLAVIRGSAVNQDGRSSGLTVPSGEAQEDVVRSALAAAGVDPADVGYVEAHGTGTLLGDPIEVRSLARTLTRDRPRERPLLVGSVKTNLGHLEAAAGVAGLMKAVLAVHHGEIPAHLHLDVPNPHIPWDEIAVEVPRQHTGWPNEPRVAGVSSFGFSGTNAHVVVANAPVQTPPPGASPAPDGAVILKVAAASPAALGVGAQRLASWATTHRDISPQALAWAAGVGRADLAERAAVVGATTDELVRGLESIAADTPAAHVRRGKVRAGARPKVAFLVPGQGSRAAGALAGLYRRDPAVTRAIDELADVLGPVDQVPLAALLVDDDDSRRALRRTEHAQPALYALAVALGAWWRHVGVQPDLLVGHSAGAYAAAALAGVFTVEDGARLVAARGRLMATMLEEGAMVAVATSVERARELMAARPGTGVTISAVNSPVEVVLAGRPAGVRAVVDEARRHGIEARPLAVERAFHSELVEPMLDAFRHRLAEVTFEPPAVELVSDTSGGLVGSEVATPDHWIDHARRPVQFAAALRQVQAAGCDHLVELGPGTTLLGLARATLDPTGVLLPSLRPGRDPGRQLRTSAATLWTAGARLSWSKLNARPGGPVPSLPTYPFQRRRYWVPESARPSAVTEGVVSTPLRQRITEVRLDPRRHPYLADHRVFGLAVVPGITYVDLLLAAATREAPASASARLRAFSVHQPLVATDAGARVQVVLDPGDGDDSGDGGDNPTRWSAQVHSAPVDDSDAGWTLHASATFDVGGTDAGIRPRPLPLSELRGRLTRRMGTEEFYRQVWPATFELGETFRLVDQVWIGPNEALGAVRPAAGRPSSASGTIRPDLLTLDAAVQLLVAAARGTRPATPGDRLVVMGTGFAELTTYGDLPEAASVWCHATIREADRQRLVGDLAVADADGRLLATLRGVTFRTVAEATLRRLAQVDDGADDRRRTREPTESRAIGHLPRRSHPTAAELRDLTPRRRHERLLTYLAEQVGAIVGLAVDELDSDERLTDVADSLMLAELRSMLVDDLGIDVSLESLFDAATIDGLASQLVDRLLDLDAAPGDSPDRPSTYMSVADLRAEATLDPRITVVEQVGGPPPGQPGPGRAVLLTGATGYVGAFVLAELVRRTDAEIRCLVPARSLPEAQDRIRTALARYDLHVETRSRLVPILGDLTQPALGLGTPELGALLDGLGAIYHLAAATQWTYPYSALRALNVDGTRQILRLATTADPVPVHLLSTVGVFSSGEHRDRAVDEIEPLERSGGLAMGYPQTKWVAEELVRTAGSRGLPVTVHRASVGPDSRTGAYDDRHHVSLVMKGCVQLGRAPILSSPLQLAPVDFIAAALVELSGNPDNHGRTFHLVNPEPLTWTAVFDHMATHGYRLERVSFPEWRQALLHTDARLSRNALSGLVPFLVESIQYVQLPRFACDATSAALQGTGVVCPPLDDILLDRHLLRMIDTGFMDPPYRSTA